ncbi:MAG TPA: maleylpyruvate isomerase N-terminal domain-containing protein [Streptosporangiaceae bacterium]|nr:maleylpyruvate isomerase N-terminal domain-containing protein [Streptosporangiaceae bacterium]
MTITSDSVEEAAAVAVAALRPGVDADWSVRAGVLEWSVDATIAHITGAPGKYALYLSSRSTRYVAVRVWPQADATRQERLEAIEGCAAALAGVAAAAPADAFGFHVTGMKNAQQFLAMACEELLVHTYDVTCGLGLPYEPPEKLCRLVIEHCYPGQAIGERPAWPYLVWLSGRPHHAAVGWGQAPEPNERSQIPLEFGRDPATGEWHAIRWVT